MGRPHRPGLLIVLSSIFRFAFFVRLPLWILTHTSIASALSASKTFQRPGRRLFVCQPRQLHRPAPDHGDAQAAAFASSCGRRSHGCLFCVGSLGWHGDPNPGDCRGRGPSSRRCARPARRWRTAMLSASSRKGGSRAPGFCCRSSAASSRSSSERPAPIVPICLDHVWGSIFSYQGGKFFWKLPQELPVPGARHLRAAAAARPPRVQRSGKRSRSFPPNRPCRRSQDRRPVHRQFVRQAASRIRSAPASSTPTPPSRTHLRRGAGRRQDTPQAPEASARRRRDRRRLAAAQHRRRHHQHRLACLGKTSVNLNYTSAPAIVQAVDPAVQHQEHPHAPSCFAHKVPIDPGPGVELHLSRRFPQEHHQAGTHPHFLGVLVAPWLHSRVPSDGPGTTQDRRHVHHHLLQRHDRRAQGRDADPRQHRRQRRIDDPGHRPATAAIALLSILPFFHSFGYTVTLWRAAAGGRVDGVSSPIRCKAAKIGELCKKAPVHDLPDDADVSASYLRRCEPDDFAALRILMCGAEKLPQIAGPGVQGKVRRPAAGRLWLHRVVAGRGGQRARLREDDTATGRQQAGHHRPAVARHRRAASSTATRSRICPPARRACCSSTAPTS